MDPQDLMYLQAELARAQGDGMPSLMIRTTELQSLISRITRLEQLPKQPVKITGYARSGEIQMMKHGKLMTMRVRRLPNEWCTQPVYIDPNEIVNHESPVLPVE